MPQMTTMPVIAAIPQAAAAGGAQTPAVGVKGGASQARATPPGAAKAAEGKDAAKPDAAKEATADDSFAAVLGRKMVQEVDAASAANSFATEAVAASATTEIVAKPDDPNENKPDDPTDAMAGIAGLLPLLQSLQPSPVSAPPSDAKGDAEGKAKADPAALRASPLQADKAGLDGLQALTEKPVLANTPVLTDTPTEDRPGTAQRKSGEGKADQPPESLLAGDSNKVGKTPTANPAALASAGETKAVQDKPTDPSQTNFANLLANAQASPQSHVGRASTPLHVEAPVGSRNWDSNVGDKVVWMVGHQEQRADLVLNPPELGKVEVSISVTGDQANAQFVSANPAVRDALEAAIPRLREMLADAGLNLGQAQVGSGEAQNSAGNSANNRENGDNSRRGSGDIGQVGALSQTGSSGTWLRQGTGMVDVFA